MPRPRRQGIGSGTTVDTQIGVPAGIAPFALIVTATVTRFVFCAPSQMPVGQLSSRQVTYR